MHIHRLNDNNILDNSVLTFGNFDGIHLGHMEIINKLKYLSKKNHLPNVLITFKPHTNAVINPNNDFKIITSFNEKIKLLKLLNIDYFCSINFNLFFSKFSADKFLELIIKKYNPKCMIFGYDNYFGYKKQGSYEYVKNNNKYKNIKIFKIKQFYKDQNLIKSSFIKNLIKDNMISIANKYLNRKFSISGIVSHGNSFGKEIGFPTANIKVKKEQLIPGNGVYSVNFRLGNESFVGICNIGTSPTIKEDGIKTIEVHVINKELELYDKEVIIEFIDFIRNEIEFPTVDKLKEQISNDIEILKNERVI